jgi:tryptophanyl-tRNA synthetase
LSKKRILSGARPTGELHLGNLFGALDNWVKLQDDYDCFYFVADWHALTSEFEDTRIIQPSIRDMVMDWVAVGIDPERSTIFIQSRIKEHAELHLILSMLVTVSRLERVPSYKDFQAQTGRDLSTYGFLGYPVLQAADILMYRAHGVPVGEDQVPHIELTRELARRFNNLYGEVFPEPEPMLTQAAKVPGTDGRKMSKSYDNTILLAEAPEDIEGKLKTMITDPARKRRTDPGDPYKCPVFDLHRIYSDQEVLKWVIDGCTSASIGCLDCKGRLIPLVIESLKPVREKRAYFAKNPREVDAIIEKGCKKAREFAQETMELVREAIKLG